MDAVKRPYWLVVVGHGLDVLIYSWTLLLSSANEKAIDPSEFKISESRISLGFHVIQSA